MTACQTGFFMMISLWQDMVVPRESHFCRLDLLRILLHGEGVVVMKRTFFLLIAFWSNLLIPLCALYLVPRGLKIVKNRSTESELICQIKRMEDITKFAQCYYVRYCYRWDPLKPDFLGAWKSVLLGLSVLKFKLNYTRKRKNDFGKKSGVSRNLA